MSPTRRLWRASLLLKREQFLKAEEYLKAAGVKKEELGQSFERYEVLAAVALAITDEVAAIIEPDVRGLLLAMVELYQLQGRPKDAVKVLRLLYRRDPDDIVVRLSLAELLVEESGSKRSCEHVLRLSKGVTNESEIHAGLLLYKAKALRKMGLLTAARETITAALRRKKDRSNDLLVALSI